jgi:hypothetical protein
MISLHIVHDEDAGRKVAQEICRFPASRQRSEGIGDSPPVGLGLKTPQEPEPGVGEPLIVQIHRVLGGQHEAHAEGARLLEERQEGTLGGWVEGIGREEPVNFVEDHEGPEMLRACLTAGPGGEFAEQEAQEEEPFAF